MSRAIRFFLLALAAATPVLAQPGMQGDGIWLRNAYFGESQTFDSCAGHQPANGQYHHHANPLCLRAQLEDNLELVRQARTGPHYKEKPGDWKHSPILGWMFDGHPIYGPYGFADARNASSGVRRMRSSFRLRSITARTTLPPWALPLHPGLTATLTASQSGPEINSVFPLGRYQEDFEFAEGFGDLDVHNGRFGVTPEFPQGTYAYFITIEADGTPAFPYIVGGQYYGSMTGGSARNIPDTAQDHFRDGTTIDSQTGALFRSWATAKSSQLAQVTAGFDPSAGPQTTWPPPNPPAGARVNGGLATPAPADVQRIRSDDARVYVDKNGLAAYVMGPWFDALQPGGMFGGWPALQNVPVQVPRSPVVPTEKTLTGLGAVGVWVNGVAVFNILDGGSYSNARQTDIGGGLVSPTSIHASATAYERGPLAAGSLIAAFPLFGGVVAAATTTAQTADWPTTLGGATITLRDAAGTSRQARIYYASPSQINYELPEDAAEGYATITVAAGGQTHTANTYIVPVYPGIFTVSADGLAAATITRIRNGQQLLESIPATGIDLGPEGDRVFLVLYGSGWNKAATVTATLGGEPAPLVFAGKQGSFPGLDQANIEIPRTLAGRGRVEVRLSAVGKSANTTYIVIR